MLVYGDVVRRVDPAAEWAAIGRAWAAACGAEPGLPRHSALIQAFIAAGELAQGMADAEAEASGVDQPGPATAVAMAALRRMADVVLRSWASGFDVEPNASAAWTALPPGELPSEVACKRGEGYAYYALYPEAFGVAASALAAEPDLRVIGLRSIGTGLAAMAAAGAGAGVPVTLRPHGHPFGRAVSPGPDAARAILAGPDASYAVVDEGPGLSGSSFAGAARWLEEAGVAAARIHLFPSHAGEPGQQAPPERRAWWRSASRRCVTFEDLALKTTRPEHQLRTWVADLVGPLQAPLEDISGGRWREKLMGAADAPVNAWQERLKYLGRSRGGAWLVKFSGVDANGAASLGRARALADAGFTPEPAGWAHGFLVQRWRDDARLLAGADAKAPPFQARLAAYLGFRAEAFPAQPGATLADLATMLQHNAAEALGPDAHGATESYRRGATALQRRVCPIITDNRLQAHEWIVTGHGSVLKTDALDHAFAHDMVGCQDVAWDVAGAVVEFGLDPDEAERLSRDVAARASREADGSLVAFLLPCYAAFQLGWHAMAADAHGGWPEEQERLRGRVDFYRESLGRLLGL